MRPRPRVGLELAKGVGLEPSSNSSPLTMSPRSWAACGRPAPPCVGRALRELAGDSAELTTGTPAPKVSTTAICRSTRSVSRILSASKSAKVFGAVAALEQERPAGADLGQPPCNVRASPANTRGG